jgi:hypothetical protein
VVAAGNALEIAENQLLINFFLLDTLELHAAWHGPEAPSLYLQLALPCLNGCLDGLVNQMNRQSQPCESIESFRTSFVAESTELWWKKVLLGVIQSCRGKREHFLRIREPNSCASNTGS